MVEAVITFVGLETEDGTTYPYTRLYRVEFETEDQFLLWLATAESQGAVDQQRLRAE